nr:hypothetical protein [Tanacetum cinerariifolium]
MDGMVFGTDGKHVNVSIIDSLSNSTPTQTEVTPNFDDMNDPTRKSTDHSGVFTSGPYTTVSVDHNNHGLILSGPNSYAKVSGEPIRKSVNFCTLITPAGNGVDLAVALESIRAISERSSYARAMIELRADVELKDTIMVAMPKLIKEGFYTCTIRVEYEWNLPSVHVVSGNKKKDVESRKEVSNPNPFDVLNSVDNDVDLGINEKNSLVDDEGKPLKNVDYPDDHDSEDEVEPVDNEMTSSLASEKVGFGTNSLLEQWKKTYENVDYYHDLCYDDMYEGQQIPDNIQSICDNFDIKLTRSGNKKKDVESRKEVSNPNPFDVLNSVDNDADLGTNEKNSLVDDEGKHLKNVDYPDDHDSEDEVEPVDNEMTSSLALEKVGFCTNSLLEQWRETYENVDYYHDLYYDEMYKG